MSTRFELIQLVLEDVKRGETPVPNGALSVLSLAALQPSEDELKAWALLERRGFDALARSTNGAAELKRCPSCGMPEALPGVRVCPSCGGDRWPTS